MKNFLIIIFFAALVSCKKYPDTIIENKIVETALSTTYTNRLNTVFDSACNALNIKGASASIIVPNIGIWKRAYGFSHTATPINTNMIFSIGSNTKTFTAATILRLQEKGLLHINDTIGKWLTNLPYVSGKITIKQLMNHTSGLAYYDTSASFINAITSNYNKIWTDNEFTQFLRPKHTNPGVTFDYSNTNYCLLGFIISKVMGKPTKNAMRELVFNPAGLTNTFYFPFENAIGVIPHFWSSIFSSNILEDLNVVYNYSPNAYHSLGGGADGCILSTAYDNNKFWFALLNGKIITKNSLAVMQQFLPVGTNVSYGLGIIEEKNYNGRTILFHDGSVIGGANTNAYDTKSNINISVHSNQDMKDPAVIVKALHKVSMAFE